MTEHQYPITLQADTVANFRRDGFVKTTDVLNAQELANTRQRLMPRWHAELPRTRAQCQTKPHTSRVLFSACDCGKPMPM